MQKTQRLGPLRLMFVTSARTVFSGIDRKLVGSKFSGALVGDQLVGHLLAFIESRQTGTLNGGYVHEHILAAVIGLDKSIALLTVEPLYGAGCHFWKYLSSHQFYGRFRSRKQAGRSLEIFGF
jgi:hypothetical protein